jgi:polyisoprenoid-binding protein YceI
MLHIMAILVLLGATEPATAGSWTLQPEESLVYVRVYKDESTVLSGQAHNHVIRATGWKGMVRFDPEHPKKCLISALFPVHGLRADEDDLRKKVGLKGTLSTGDQSKVEKNMTASNQLDMEGHAFIRFKATKCSLGPKPGHLSATARLTVRGKTFKTSIPVSFQLAEGVLQASGSFEATHADFGLKPYSAMLGAVANREELSFTFQIVAARKN